MININKQEVIRQIDSRNQKNREFKQLKTLDKQNSEAFEKHAMEYYKKVPLTQDEYDKQIKEMQKENEYKSNKHKGQGNQMRINL